jgi:membrane-associated phospholipid phosphatase
MPASHLFDGFDLPILTFLTSFAGRSHLFDHMVNAVSRLDIFKGIALMCLFWYVWADPPAGETVFGREERQQRLVRILIGTLLLGALSRGLQVTLSVHQRPLLSNLGLNFPITDFGPNSLNNWNSFPSDHSMFFFALGAGLWSINRTVGLIAFIWTIFVIGLPRAYLGIHYPSDVVFGALFGFFGMKVFLALPSRRFDSLVTGWRHTRQGLFMAALFLISEEIGHQMAELRDLVHSSMHVLIH